ncbi:hypothetical protein ABBQ38_001665 [Trebouxia sp. C0009 RCD-2024]
MGRGAVFSKVTMDRREPTGPTCATSAILKLLASISSHRSCTFIFQMLEYPSAWVTTWPASRTLAGTRKTPYGADAQKRTDGGDALLQGLVAVPLPREQPGPSVPSTSESSRNTEQHSRPADFLHAPASSGMRISAWTQPTTPACTASLRVPCPFHDADPTTIIESGTMALCIVQAQESFVDTAGPMQESTMFMSFKT